VPLALVSRQKLQPGGDSGLRSRVKGNGESLANRKKVDVIFIGVGSAGIRDCSGRKNWGVAVDGSKRLVC